jgi:REP element-mobilizing transposase RayT
MKQKTKTTCAPDLPKRHSIRWDGFDYSQNGMYFVTIVLHQRVLKIGARTKNGQTRGSAPTTDFLNVKRDAAMGNAAICGGPGIGIPYFGVVVDGKMILNDVGDMVQKWMRKIPDKFPNAKLPEFVVMPDHIHAIIAIQNPKQHMQHTVPLPHEKSVVGADPRVCPSLDSDPRTTLPQIIQWFKTMTTNEYIRGAKECGWIPFAKYFWQRNYHERVIRDEMSHQKSCAYIADNPMQWWLEHCKYF